MNDDAVGANMVKVAAFFKGILCNILVCLAVRLALAGRSVIDKIFATIFPISAFVAAGFEHKYLKHPHDKYMQREIIELARRLDELKEGKKKE